MSKSHGFGIIECIVAASVGMIIIMAISSVMSGVNSSIRKLESITDLLIIKSMVADATNCSQTLAASPTCTTLGGYVALRNASGNVAVTLNGTQIGRFLVRAHCDVGGGIDVRAAKLTQAGMLAPSALDFSATDASWFQKDEKDKTLLYNWLHPKGRILSNMPGNDMRLCKPFF